MAKAKEQEVKQDIELCEPCQSDQHGCEQYFCMCDCRHPLPWREGSTTAYNTIEDARGQTLLYDVISNKRPSEIRARVLRAVNNHGGASRSGAQGYQSHVLSALGIRSTRTQRQSRSLRGAERIRSKMTTRTHTDERRYANTDPSLHYNHSEPKRDVCAQCESNARWNKAGGYHELAKHCREYCRRGHKE